MAEPVGAAGRTSISQSEAEPPAQDPVPSKSVGQRVLDAWEGAADVVREASSGAGRALRNLDAAIDVEGRVRDLGPGDSYRLRAQGHARLAAGASAGGTVEVRRLDDGRYRVSGQGDLGLLAGTALNRALSGKLEQGPSAKLEYTCDTPQEAAALLRTVRDLQLAPLGMPVANHPHARLLVDKLSAVELSGKTALRLESSLGLPERVPLEARAGLRVEQGVRVELEKAGPVLVAQTSTTGELGLVLNRRNPPGTPGVLPSISLGQGGRGQSQLLSETRVPLRGNPRESLAKATTRVTLAVELRASSGASGVGRELKASAELPTAVAALSMAALARGDLEGARPLLEAKVRADVRDYQEGGGEWSAALSLGMASAGVVLEARHRDMAGTPRPTDAVPLREVLAWVSGDRP